MACQVCLDGGAVGEGVLCVHVYIYIYIERERDVYISTYIYIYTYVHMYIHTQIPTCVYSGCVCAAYADMM